MQQRKRSDAGKHADNRIFGILITILILLLAVSAFGMQKGYSSALALEQQVRCGMEEHIHTDECYINHVLVCGQKAHTHSGDCYLLLLEQNDVNMLLSEMENSEDKSLESLLTGTVNEAIQLNQLVSAEPLPKNDNQLTVSEITTLNNVIEENQINPAVVLNENAGVAMIDTKAAGGGDNAVMPLASGTPENPKDGEAYIYLYVDDHDDNDDKWVHIGSMEFEQVSYYNAIKAEELLTLLNEKIEPDLTTTDFSVAYAFSPDSDSGDGKSTIWEEYGVYTLGWYYQTNAKYVRIVAKGGAPWYSTSFAFHTVIFQYADNTEEILYVRSGNSINPAELKPGTEWVDSAGNSVTGAVTIGTKTVFTEVPSITLTLDYLDKEDVQITFDTKTETTLPDDAIWLDEDGNRADGTILMNSSKTFYEACKVTLNYLNGTSQTQYVKPGNEIMLPAEHNWIDETGNSAADTVTVWNHAVFTETYPDKTVTYIDMEDSSNNMEVNVAHGGSHVVRDGTWYQGSTVYYGGDVISNITRDITLIGNARLNLYYDLNFPTYNEMWITYNGTEPTLAGLTTQTCTDQITPVNSQVTLRNVSSREVFALVNSGNGMNRSIYFAGWSVNGDKEHLIEPGTIFRWDELYAMLDGGGNTIKLEGVWEYDSSRTVSFFIRYDSATYDTNGNIVGDDPNNYTKEVFNGHLFADPNSVFSNSASTNTSLYAIASDTSENSVEIDTKIRSLYGSGLSYTFEYTPKNNVTFYMKSFPDDADVIAKIKDQVQANGKQIYADDGFGKKELIEDLNDLDTNHFTIRWYVFKQEGDAWHVDGKLVKKVGTIHVSKTFGGNENLVSQVKAATGEKQFHITANNGERTETMYLTDKDVVYNAATDTYTWTISKVNYNERWTITEHNSDSVLNDAVGLEEWVTVDTYNGTSNSGDGNSTTVVGVTHAADTVNDEWLRADFTNVYHMGNTLLVRKVDGETGKPLAGATFQLEQNGEVMRFSFNEDNDAYEWDQENGTVLQLSTSENGYLEVIDNFTYEAGAVTVREISTPKGYSAAGEVVLNYTGTEGKREVAIINDVTIIRKGRETEYATYQAGVLTVNNYSDTISVTAEKIWNCGEEYYRNLNAEVQLYADGKLVSSVIPGTSDHTVLLTPSNGYSYTWDGLPAYANGSKIDWSIKETAIGNASGGYEMADSKGIFPNWIASYTNPRYGTDGDGFETVLLQVHNDVKRTLLRLTKYNGSKSQLLAGAEFELTAVDNDGNAISGVPSKIGITDDNGLLIFDNLKYATRYRLKEIGAPDGYFAYSQPAYLTIGTDGTVTVEEHSYVSAGSAAYNITVINRSAGTLPNTGGAGTLSYTLGGLLLMLAAASLFVYKKILTKKVK